MFICANSCWDADAGNGACVVRMMREPDEDLPGKGGVGMTSGSGSMDRDAAGEYSTGGAEGGQEVLGWCEDDGGAGLDVTLMILRG